jgi:tetratricopeptide (TPR) repeat protein
VALAAADATLRAGDAAAAFAIARHALLGVPADTQLLRLAGDCALRLGRVRTATLARRAADAPHDPQRFFELGSALLAEDDACLAEAALGHALALAPFDAVARSERALAQARQGKHREAVETLSLHPCLADDPGALFQFSWSSLLSGDREAAAGAAERLRTLRDDADELVLRLDDALARATVPPDADPPDARDLLYLQHGGLLLEPAPTADARYGALTVDAGRAASIVSRAAVALGLLGIEPPAVHAADEASAPYAEALAVLLGRPMPVLPEAGRVPDGVLVGRDALALVPLLPRLGATRDGVVALAIAQRWRVRAPMAADLVGAFAADLRFEVDAQELLERARASRRHGGTPVHARLQSFVERRRAFLPPAGRRLRAAWVGDALPDAERFGG